MKACILSLAIDAWTVGIRYVPTVQHPQKQDTVLFALTLYHVVTIRIQYGVNRANARSALIVPMCTRVRIAVKLDAMIVVMQAPVENAEILTANPA